MCIEGGIEGRVDSASSWSKSSQDKAESREEREPGGPTEKEAGSGSQPLVIDKTKEYIEELPSIKY